MSILSVDLLISTNVKRLHSSDECCSVTENATISENTLDRYLRNALTFIISRVDI